MDTYKSVSLALLAAASIGLSPTYGQDVKNGPVQPGVSKGNPPCHGVPGYRVCEYRVPLMLSDSEWEWIKSTSERNKSMVQDNKPAAK